VVVEAEHAHASAAATDGHAWAARADLAGFAGDGFVRAEPDAGGNVNTGYAAAGASPRLSFQVAFATAGTYHVWVRAWATDDNGDSLHAGLDGAAVASADRIQVNTKGAWVWTKATIDGPVATLSVTAGSRTVDLWMREDGLRVDRVLLTTDATLVPTGAGPA